jgi:two-component system, NarL family, nitrate/nitrite response regulator NarL
MLKVLLVEDNALLRTSLADALGSTELKVVAACATASEAVEELRRGPVDVLVTDLDLGEGPDGISLAHVVRRMLPLAGIVVLTGYRDPRLVAGKLVQVPPGTEYVVKESVGSMDALRGAIDRSLLRAARADAGRGTRSADIGIDLTDSQVETMRLVAEGLSNAEIAERRCVTVGAVEVAVSRIARALGIQHDRAHNQRVMITREYYRLTGGSPGSRS